jgi:membrane protease YdiL (CAAX protease family)
MSDLPEQFPVEPPKIALPEETAGTEILISRARADEPVTPFPVFIAPFHDAPPDPPSDQAPPLFQHFIRPVTPLQERIPHMGHLGILFLIALAGLACAALLARAAVAYRLFGVSTITEAATEFHYTLGTEGVFYLLTFAGSLLIFPLLWHKSLLAGLQWRAKAARARSGYLISAALVCFLLAMVDGMLLPGPADAPIDRIFRMPGAAWLLFAFGVTLAPFFEELAFRGFLLPSLCTTFDWLAEKFSGEPPHFLDENGHPQWSIPSMLVASLLTSLLFALMHADQTGYSLGPFLLLVCVSLVLCAARLLTRSLAASVLVHACYNFLLFTFMFLGTSGFKHLDNM